MSRTINLVAGLLGAARHLQETGQVQPALDLLERLASFRNLAPTVVEDVHSRLAELFARREQFKKARRHLTIALTHAPEHGEYYNRMARYIEDDAEAAIERAGPHHRQAVRCEPKSADYWAAYGDHLVEAGRIEEGRRALRRAVRLVGQDADAIGALAESLRWAGLWDDAQQLLRRCLFENAHDRRFRALWQQHRFKRLHHEQVSRAESAAEKTPGPRLLPFLRPTRPPTRAVVDGKIIRIDAGGPDGFPSPNHRRKARRNRDVR